MAIVREYTCPGHGDFESTEARCPHGCTVVAEREFRTAPAYHNGKTQRTDRMVREQVESLGLSNIRSARTGETSRVQDPKASRMAEFQNAVRAKYPRVWGSIPNGKVEDALAAHKAPATNALAEAKDMMAAQKRPTEYIRDPQNLKVDVSKAA